jgi:hypothetical protein
MFPLQGYVLFEIMPGREDRHRLHGEMLANVEDVFRLVFKKILL